MQAIFSVIPSEIAFPHSELKPTPHFHIAESVSAKSYYNELQELFQKEWPDIPSIDVNQETIPPPLFALTEANELAGGLAFIEAKSPVSDELVVWVNAVLVLPEYRRQGVGTRLIAAAERAARLLDTSCLYALTELPDLYSKQNWSVIRSDGVDYVMVLSLNSEVQEDP